MKKKTRTGLLGTIAAAALACGLCGCAVEVNISSSSAGGAGDTTAPTITFACSESYLAALDTRFTIPVEDILVLDDVDEVEPAFSVTFQGEAVPLSDHSFAVDRAGVYTVVVEAADKAGNRAEKKITVHTTEEGEINSFDDETRVAQAAAKGYAEVSLNTDPQFVKDGKGSLKLQIKTHPALGWPGVIVQNLPINNILGYYSVSFWAYNDGKEDVEIILNRNDVSEKAKFKLEAKLWTKVEVKARNYDEVFKVMEATAWGEPECGMCEDLKCLTFHLVNPANSPQYDIYVDSMRVNAEAVYDTLDIETQVSHPVVGEKYAMPAVTVKQGGAPVDAEVSYKIFDENYDEVPFAGKEITFAKEGRYTLRVEAAFGGLIGRKNYMLIVARTRADNEIEFFESDSALFFFTSETLTLGIDRAIRHDANGSTGSLKINSSPSIWPYLTIGNVPHANLEGVAYIYFYAKTDYQLTATQTAYIGLRNGRQNKVLKRMKLTNEWQGYSFTKQQLENLGVDTLDGLQLSVELYDTDDTANGGWVPVAFTTYLDNFSAGLETEPTEKEENVVLDFANYRDLDDIDSAYASYWFFDPAYTLNGVGSMKFSCADGRWPSLTLGSKFAKYDLEYVKSLLVDVYVPEIAEGHNVRIGANSKGYNRLYAGDAGKWLTLEIPVNALRNKTVEGENVLLPTLENVSLTFGRNDGGADINFGTIYIGKIALEYYDVDPADKDHVKPAGVLYDFYNFREAEEIKHPAAIGEYTKFDGHRTAKLVMTNSAWGKIYLPASADAMVTDLSGVSYIYLDIFADAALVDGEYIRFTYQYWNGSKYVEKFFDSFIPVNEWTTVRFPVKEGTAKLSDLYFYFVKYSKTAAGDYEWQPIGQNEGEALYIREIGYTSNAAALRDFDGESAWSTGIFYTQNDDYVVFRNGDRAFVKEGSYSIGLMAAPRWPGFYFTDAFVDWLEQEGYTSISFDVYIDGAEGNLVTKIEGIGANSSPKNNEWFTVTAEVSKLRGACIQFNHEKAVRLYVYLDNLTFSDAPVLPEHVKAAGVLYDFYDEAEAAQIVHPSAAGVYTEFGGFKTAKLVMKEGAWDKIYLPASADAMVTDLSGVSFVYLDVFVEAPAVDGEYVRFTYEYWNGSKYAEKFFDSLVPLNQWTTVRFPVKAGTAKLSDLYFYFVKYSKTAAGDYGWQPIGRNEGEALYIREIGYTSNAAALRDFDGESAWSTGMFYTQNDDYVVFRNGDPTFVKEGSYSIGLMAAPRWPGFYFTDAFVDWLEQKGYTSISFDVYIDGAEGNLVTKIEGIGATSSPKNNEWFTVTAEVSKLRGARIQFNHQKADRLFFYIDNMVFAKA